MTTTNLLSRVYRRFIWSIYDNIGNLILINLLWFSLLPLPSYLIFRFCPAESAKLRLWLAVLFILLINPYATGGVFAFTANLVKHRPALIRDFFRFRFKLYWRILVVTSIYMLLITLLVIALRFYSHTTQLGIMGKGLAIWQMTMIILILLVCQYSLPLLTLRQTGVRQCLKLSGLLMMLRPGYSVLILIQALAMVFILSITGIGLAVLAVAAASTFLNSATEISIKQLEISNQSKQKPTSWKEIFKKHEDQDQDRSLRELFRPWELK